MARFHSFRQIHVINEKEQQELKEILLKMKNYCKCCCPFVYKRMKRINSFEMESCDLDDIEYDSVYKMCDNDL